MSGGVLYFDGGFFFLVSTTDLALVFGNLLVRVTIEHLEDKDQDLDFSHYFEGRQCRE